MCGALTNLCKVKYPLIIMATTINWSEGMIINENPWGENINILCTTLRGRHQRFELWYVTDIPQFAVVYQNIPQLQGYIPQLPYTACLPLMRLRSV